MTKAQKTKAKPQTRTPRKTKSSWIAALSYINIHWLQLTIAVIFGHYLEPVALGFQSVMALMGGAK